MSRPTLDSAWAHSDFVYGAFTLSGRLSQSRSTILISPVLRSEPRHARTPVWALARSLAATGAITVVFSSSGYLDVSVRRVPLAYLCVQYTMTVVCTAGFPHSEISGSLVVCTSPKLFAAYHVFHRLPVPRHPPCALSRITISLLRRDVRAGNTRSVACAGCLVCMTSSCPPWSFVFPRMSSLGLLSQTSIRYLSSLPYAVFKVRFDRYSDQSPDSSSLFLRNLIADLSA